VDDADPSGHSVSVSELQYLSAYLKRLIVGEENNLGLRLEYRLVNADGAVSMQRVVCYVQELYDFHLFMLL
jgi:hypothetical protein